MNSPKITLEDLFLSPSPFDLGPTNKKRRYFIRSKKKKIISNNRVE